MGGSTQSNSNQLSWSTGTSNTEPWAVQTPYLKQAFGRAEDAYAKNMATGAYGGDYVAQGDAQNTNAFNQAYNFGTSAANQGRVDNLLNLSQDWMNTGTDWANQGAAGLANLAGDQTQNIIRQAGQYADNPYISAAIQSAMYDANRQASENTLPNMYRSAAGNNALNSDRAALSQGVVERGLAEMAGNLSGTMRYNAYDRGIGAAQSELNTRRGAYGDLGRMGQSGQQLGMTGMAQGIENQSRLNQMAAAGAEGNRMLRQYGLDNEMAKYQGQQNFPWAALNNYYNIIGNKSWGGSTSWNQIGGSESNSYTKQNPGVDSIVGGALGGIGGLFSGGANSAAAGLAGAGKGLFSFL